MEYDSRAGSGDRLFRESLRSSGDLRRTFNIARANDKSDITNYLNWSSNSGRIENKKIAKINKEVTERLASGSPNRETTIKYKFGNLNDSNVTEMEVPTYQGY